MERVMAAQSCRACGGSSLTPFYELGRVPVQSCVLLAQRSEALAYPTARLRLSICGTCGFIQNDFFRPELVANEDYESSQAHSARFRQYMDELCRKLIDEFGVEGRRVLEVGAGAGDFLRHLCDAGRNQGVGFDPAYPGPATAEGRVRFVKDCYDERFFDQPFDCLVCRHTLEHIADVSGFASLLHDACARDPERLIVIEVPDATRILEDCAFWDVYYEHCAYFSAGSLGRLFQRKGFALKGLDLVYDGQYLVLTASPRAPSQPAEVAVPQDCSALQALAERFAEQVGERRAEWQQRLEQWRESGKRAVLWGAGSKAAGFLTTIGGTELIDYIVDINPRKQGMFQAGSGQKIIAPSELAEIRPDAVIVMNPIYREEIRRDLRTINLEPELLSL